jgi:hypothetical protein
MSREMKVWIIALTVCLAFSIGLAQDNNRRQANGKAYQQSAKRPKTNKTSVRRRQIRNKGAKQQPKPKPRQQKKLLRTSEVQKVKEHLTKPKKLSEYDRLRIEWYRDIIQRGKIHGR